MLHLLFLLLRLLSSHDYICSHTHSLYYIFINNIYIYFIYSVLLLQVLIFSYTHLYNTNTDYASYSEKPDIKIW